MTSNHKETHDLYLDRTANDRMTCVACECDTHDTFGDIDWQQHHGEQYCGDCVEAGEHLHEDDGGDTCTCGDCMGDYIDAVYEDVRDRMMTAVVS